MLICSVVVVGRFHSITPSLSVRHLESPPGAGGGGRAELPYGKVRSENWNLTPKDD